MIIQILNLFDLFFIQFFNILSYNTKKKAKFFLLKNLIKFLKDKKLLLKFQNKAIANYTKYL